ncbi:hypothetical protein ASD77_08830 [Pseudoxanthomonas sp. Root65]|jgi:hypothetical protein|uniref:hypothetical protein n=1 Tax=Pseudoxanthomonas sp. Root65 TaxID=1736576 RepID=UPI0007013191|nr:hypothetical protein [Pseudoxanthomonas sp. Root65]KRA54678.1 hypothetical protein ASD77_08830 [Pseudoxanthomonas sp. Root65]
MALFDALDLLDLLDLFLSWRFWVCLIAGVGLGFGVYTLGNESNIATILGMGIGVTGLITGLIWEWRHDRTR